MTIQIPSAKPATVDLPVLGASTARAYRDKLRERVELQKRGCSAGEMPYSEYLRAVVHLDDAEIAAAASADDRKKAQQAKVEL